jgi:hypothetical protein
MTDSNRPPTTTGRASEIDAFLEKAKTVVPAEASHGHLVFALDATMSRQPTWDLACRLQAGMFEAAAGLGGLRVQLVYYRGFGECRASRWLADAAALTGLMNRIACRGGRTQIERVLRHVKAQAGSVRIGVLVFVGDAMEEDIDAVCAAAGELGLVGVKAFMFQEGSDPQATRAFAEVARLTGGVHERFDSNAPQSLASLLRAAAAYATGGTSGLARLAGSDATARRLLTSLGGER